MYWASPRTPCSGPKRAWSRTPGRAWSRSAAWRSRPSTALGLQISPTRRPRSGPPRERSRTSSPTPTGGSASRPEREAERGAARLLGWVGGILQVPPGAGPDIVVVEGVLEHLDQGGAPRGVDGHPDGQRAGEAGQVLEPLAVGGVDETAHRPLQRRHVGDRQLAQVDPALGGGPVGR